MNNVSQKMAAKAASYLDEADVRLLTRYFDPPEGFSGFMFDCWRSGPSNELTAENLAGASLDVSSVHSASFAYGHNALERFGVFGEVDARNVVSHDCIGAREMNRHGDGVSKSPIGFVRFLPLA